LKPAKKFCYFLFHKPYGVLCQFSGSGARKTLKDFGPFPKDVYPVGRLDAGSEGLVLLTNDGLLKHRLLEPQYRHPRTYLAQVERVPSRHALERLRAGLLIEGRRTRPAKARLLERALRLPERPVPVRVRKTVPTAWLEVTLFEGRNRQVRKMTAAVGHPTLRLIRTAIGPLKLEGLKPGESRALIPKEVDALKTAVTA
jgi:23S rRNA pseudouridine2457 synthase